MSTNLTAVLQQILQNTTNFKVLRELKHEIPERVGGSRQRLGLRCRYWHFRWHHQQGIRASPDCLQVQIIAQT